MFRNFYWITTFTFVLANLAKFFLMAESIAKLTIIVLALTMYYIFDLMQNLGNEWEIISTQKIPRTKPGQNMKYVVKIFGCQKIIF